MARQRNVTIVEQTINGGKVISFVCGDMGEGDALVETAERQTSHWEECKIDKVSVFDKSQIPPESIFTLPAGGVAGATEFDIHQLYTVMKSVLLGEPDPSIP